MTKSSLHGFTLVETLVAIAILMIAIAGPLSIASKGLRAALYARDQVTATFLAQESLEVVKNIRDNNIGNGDDTNWLDGLGYTLQSPQHCYVDSTSNIHGCDASAIDSYSITDCPSGGCPLYADDTGYRHDPSSIVSLFKRYYYITHPNGYPPDSEVRVNIVVSWNEGTIPYEVDLGSELVDTAR